MAYSSTPYMLFKGLFQSSVPRDADADYFDDFDRCTMSVDIDGYEWSKFYRTPIPPVHPRYDLIKPSLLSSGYLVAGICLILLSFLILYCYYSRFPLCVSHPSSRSSNCLTRIIMNCIILLCFSVFCVYGSIPIIEYITTYRLINRFYNRD